MSKLLFGLVLAYRGYQITQSFPITQLTEYQYQQMIPA